MSKIEDIMDMVDAAIAGAEEHQATDMIRYEIKAALRELVREPLSHDDANKLWEDCLKKYKRPGPYEFIVEFCNITNTTGVE